MKLVIIGGDAAGMSAASRAKRLDPSLEVIVLEQTQDVSYSACGMPYNIADPARSMDDLVVRAANVFREKMDIKLMTGHRVEAVHPGDRCVTVTDDSGGRRSIDYNHLLIATGARPIIPDLPGIDLPGVLALKSLAQGRAIKDFLEQHPVSQAVILGMGYIAMEMAEALRSRDINVTLIKPGPDLLPWLARELAATVRQELEHHQVVIDAGNAIQGIEPSNGRLQVMTRTSVYPTDMVLVAAGVQPNSELAAQAGLTLGPSRSIAVDRGLRTSQEAVFAAGDCADAFHVVTGQRVWLPLALRANRAGWAVADQVCGHPVTLPGVVGTAVFKVFDLEVARTGLTAGEASQAGFDPAQVTITTRSRAHSHPGSVPIQVHMVGDKRSGRLLGAQMVAKEGVAHRINAAAVALQTHMSVADFTQCDLSYAPPFGPVWDPLLTAAIQLTKAM